MSITYCHNCNKNIDTDFDATHIEDCVEQDGLSHIKQAKTKKITFGAVTGDGIMDLETGKPVTFGEMGEYKNTSDNGETILEFTKEGKIIDPKGKFDEMMGNPMQRIEELEKEVKELKDKYVAKA